MQDRVGNEVKVGDFIVYVTRSESPSLQFGWVEEFKDVKNKWTDRVTSRMKVQHAKPDGTRLNKTVYVSGEGWNPVEGRYEVSPYNRDTGTPSVVWLDASMVRDNRMMVMLPL